MNSVETIFSSNYFSEIRTRNISRFECFCNFLITLFLRFFFKLRYAENEPLFFKVFLNKLVVSGAKPGKRKDMRPGPHQKIENLN